MTAWERQGGDATLPPGTNRGRLVTSAQPGSAPILVPAVSIVGPEYMISLPCDTQNIFDTSKIGLVSVGCAHKDSAGKNVWTENRGTVISRPGRPAVVHGRLVAEMLEVHFLMGVQAGVDTIYANTGVTPPTIEPVSCDLWLETYPGHQQSGALGSGQVPPFGQEQYLSSGSTNLDPGSSFTAPPARSYSGVADLNIHSYESPVLCTLTFYGMVLSGDDRGDMIVTGRNVFRSNGHYQITLPTDVVTLTIENIGSANTNVDYSLMSRVHSI